MIAGEKCNYTYGLDLEFTNCSNNRQVINTIQVAYNNVPEDVVIIFFKLDENYESKLKKDIRESCNSLSKFISSRKHIKVGVNIIDDLAKINNELDIKMLGYIDLQSIAISLGIHNASMDDLGLQFMPKYVPKNKVYGGYLSLDEKKIDYIAKDAINSLEIYYAMISSTKQYYKKKIIKLDQGSIMFGLEYLEKYPKITFDCFVNHMYSCYSQWCKYLTKAEARSLAYQMIMMFKRKSIVSYTRNIIELKESYKANICFEEQTQSTEDKQISSPN